MKGDISRPKAKVVSPIDKSLVNKNNKVPMRIVRPDTKNKVTKKSIARHIKSNKPNGPKNHLMHDMTSGSIGRSSILLGAVFVCLLANLLIWQFAKYYGYSFDLSIGIIALFVGGSLGLLTELLARLLKRIIKN
jgi:hypothetical protein